MISLRLHRLGCETQSLWDTKAGTQSRFNQSDRDRTFDNEAGEPRSWSCLQCRSLRGPLSALSKRSSSPFFQESVAYEAPKPYVRRTSFGPQHVARVTLTRLVEKSQTVDNRESRLEEKTRSCNLTRYGANCKARVHEALLHGPLSCRLFLTGLNARVEEDSDEL